MLSNSNVFILLILIKHLVLLEITSANLLAVNAYVNIDDTKSTTDETVTTPLSHVGHHFIEGDKTSSTIIAAATATTTAFIRLITDDVKAGTLTKAPLVSGNSEQFPSITDKTDNDNIKKSVDYGNGLRDDDGDDDSNDDANPYIQLLPQSDAPSISTAINASTDIVTDPQLELSKPRSDAVYFIVAVIGGAKLWARSLARTLNEMGPPFSGDPLGSPLRPIYIDLPTNGR